MPINNVNWDQNFARSEWTLGMWFMLEQLPQVTDSPMTLLSLEVNQGFEAIILVCEIKATLKLSCFEDVPGLAMELDLTQMQFEAKHWYYLLVASKDNYHRLTVLSQDWEKQLDRPVVTDRPASLGNLNVNIGLQQNGAK